MCSSSSEESSTVASGALSCQISLALKSDTSVAAKIAVGFVAVPTDISPPVPVESEADALAEGEIDAEGEILVDALGDTLALGLLDAEGLKLGLALDDGLTEAEGLLDSLDDGDTERLGLVETLAEGLVLSEGEAERLREGDVEALGETEGLVDADSEALGLREADGDSLALALAEGERLELGDSDALGETDADAGLKAVTTLANRRSNTAPVTVRSVPVPIAPLPVLPSKVTVFSIANDQSVSTTGAPFLFCCAVICFPLFVYRDMLITGKHIRFLLTQASYLLYLRSYLEFCLVI
jgi:hypothetical protein